MNSTGCDDGRATDTILWFNNPNRCDMAISSWIVIGVFAAGSKFLVAIGQLDLWLRRERRHRANSLATRTDLICKTKLPIIPTMSFLSTIAEVIFFTLTGLNIANGPNGMASFLYGIGMLPWGIATILFLLKFVRLGHRVIGKGVIWRSSLEAWHLNQLSTVGRLAFLSTTLSIIGLLLSFCLFGVVFPNQVVLVEIGSGFIGCVCLFSFLGQVNHMQRVKNAYVQQLEPVYLLTNNLPSIDEVFAKTLVNDSGEGVRELRLANRRLSEHVLTAAGLGIVSSLIGFLVAAKVLLPSYYIITLPFWEDSITEGAILVSNYRYVLRGRQTQQVDLRSSSNSDI